MKESRNNKEGGADGKDQINGTDLGDLRGFSRSRKKKGEGEKEREEVNDWCVWFSLWSLSLYISMSLCLISICFYALYLQGA